MSSRGVRWLFAATLAAAAFLLFWAELLFGRALLPLLGGTPAVWMTCLLFFQAALLLGYTACRLSARWVGTKWQVAGLTALLLAGGALLPFTLDASLLSGPNASPVGGILLVLSCALGLPFLGVATLAPLLQAWYGCLGREDSADPYFLYGASNAGSFAALLIQPTLIDPAVSLSAQIRLWQVGYWVLAVALVVCAGVVLRARSRQPPLPAPGVDETPAFGRTELGWVWLSFVPAALLYGVTTEITTDVAPIPLLWAAPLAIYLGSFVVAFSKRRLLPYDLLRALLPLVLAALIISVLFGNRGSLELVLSLHLGGFAVVACVLHRDLATLRPALTSAGRLEGYYLWIALGGFLAGVAHAVVAPQVLHTSVEYPWALVLAGVLAASLGAGPQGGLVRVARASRAFAGGILACVLLAGWSLQDFAKNVPGYLVVLVVLALLTRSFQVGRLRALTALVFLLLIGQCALGPLGDSLYVERSFYGVQRVLHDEGRQLHTLWHGTTVHGRQSYAPTQRGVPLSYYGRQGPIGHVFAALERKGQPSRVAVIGLGVGCLSVYARPLQSWEFYEIDPASERIARDPALFSFMADAQVPIQVVLGDARIVLEARPEKVYDLLVLDAFCSDAIPTHLLTREAIGLYLRRLAPRGLLIANISNRYMDLEPILATHAKDLGLFARVRRDLRPSESSRKAGISGSSWVALGRVQDALAGLDDDERWVELRENDAPAWTDDHASVFSAIRSAR